MRAYDPAVGRDRRRARPRARGLHRSLRGGERRARCSPCSPSGTSSAGSTSTACRRSDGRTTRDRRRPQPARPRGACAAAGSPTRASAADAASSRHRRRRLPRVRTSATLLARASGTSSRSTTSSPATATTSRTSPTTPASRFVEHDVIDGIPVDGPRRRGDALRQPGEPARVPRASLRDARGRVDRHSSRARPRARERRALPPRVDERDLRRSARAPATGELLRQRQQRRPARRCTTRPSATPRRSRWRTTASYGVDTKIVRIFNTYGPRLGAADGRVVSNFLAQAMRGEPLTVYGDGKQTRSFCYVDDEVEGLRRAARLRPRRTDEHRQPERVHRARARRAGARRHRELESTWSSSRCRPTTRSSADPTSPWPSACSVGIPASTSAKVSPARTTGTGGSVSPDETHDYRKLSVIVPVLDERNTVVEIVRRMRAVELPRRPRDHRSSTTAAPTARATCCASSPTARCGSSRTPTNRGKGAAVRSGFAHVTGDLVLDPGRRPRVRPRGLAQAARARCCAARHGVVYGSRFTGERRNMLFLHWVGNRFLSLVTNVLYNTTLSDMETCYKLFDRDAARRHHAPGPALRLRTRDHGQDPAAGHPHLRGADLVHRARVRRGQEDHLARRLRGALDPGQVPLRGLMTRRNPPPVGGRRRQLQVGDLLVDCVRSILAETSGGAGRCRRRRQRLDRRHRRRPAHGDSRTSPSSIAGATWGTRRGQPRDRRHDAPSSRCATPISWSNRGSAAAMLAPSTPKPTSAPSGP